VEGRESVDIYVVWSTRPCVCALRSSESYPVMPIMAKRASVTAHFRPNNGSRHSSSLVSPSVVVVVVVVVYYFLITVWISG
jgi:hypothetical protein